MDSAQTAEPIVILLMGVAGSGKTTLGRLLAEELGWPFFDADDYHTAANVAKMAQGMPLTDDDRQPWLAILHDLIHAQLVQRRSAIVACSALKDAYRTLLRRENPGLRFVYLQVMPEVACARMRTRTGHFMPASLVESQFTVLEEPAEALVIDATQPPQEAVRAIRHTFGI